MHHPTHMQELMARALADQAEEAALEYATTWQAVTAGAITQAEYYEALRADLEEEDAHYDGEPLPAELTDDDISPATARATGVLRRAWRELVARLNP